MSRDVRQTPPDRRQRLLFGLEVVATLAILTAMWGDLILVWAETLK